MHPSPKAQEPHPLKLVTDRQDQLAARLGSEDALARLRAGRQPAAASTQLAQSPAESSDSDAPAQHSPSPRAGVPVCGGLMMGSDSCADGLSIHPELHPTITEASLRRIDAEGMYAATAEDKAMHQHFMSRQHVLPMLAQDHLATSLLLYDTKDSTCYRPGTVLVDTGADLFICVSQHWAKQCGLTVEPGSSQLVGVGGVGGATGIAQQKIRVTLGGTGEPGELSASALQGVLTLRLRPYIMTPKMQRDINCEVIIGGAFLRACLGSIDYLKETLDISPAWLEHQLPDLRVSIPLVTSRARASQVTIIRTTAPQMPSMHDLLALDRRSSGRSHTAAASSSRARSLTASPARRRHVRERAVRSGSPAGSRGVLALAERVIAAATQQPAPAAPRMACPVVAAPLHPGFPQAPGAPTPEQYAQRGAQVAARTAVREQARAGGLLPQTFTMGAEPSALQPIGVVYPLDQLRATGRLREGFVVDLHPVAEQPQLNPNQLEHLVESAARRVMERLSTQGQRTYRDVAQSAVPPTVLQRPAPARSAPAETLQARVHTPGPPAASTSTPATTPAVPPPQAEAPPLLSSRAPAPETQVQARPASNTRPTPSTAPTARATQPRSRREQRSSSPPQPSRHGMATRARSTAETPAPAANSETMAITDQPQRPSGTSTTRLGPVVVDVMKPSAPVIPRVWLQSKNKGRLPLAEAIKSLTASGVRPGLRLHLTAGTGSTR